MHTHDANNPSQPAFLIKLWKLVEGSDCDDLIAWSDDGNSFIIRDPARFAKNLLPQYFKHSNMASFIRQLNMYGFRKVLNYEKSGLHTEVDEMVFQHANFRKGQSDLLVQIKRKMTSKGPEPVKTHPRDILTDLTSIREKQENMDNLLGKMKQENELLWRELTSMRQKHKAQEQIIQKVIQFLVSIVQRSNQSLGVQRKIPHMLGYSSGRKRKPTSVNGTLDVLRNKNSDCFTVSPGHLKNSGQVISPLGPVIHEVTEFDPEEVLVMEGTVDAPNTPVQDECPTNSGLNSPINSTAIEPLSILEPLQTSVPLNVEESSQEQVLGLPLDFESSNVISIPETPNQYNDMMMDELILAGPSFQVNKDNVLVFESSPIKNVKSEILDYPNEETVVESLNTPQVPVVHILDLQSPSEESESVGSPIKEVSQERDAGQENNYQIAISDTSLVKPNKINKDALSSHILNVEEELNWLQDQISSNTWNIDASKLLGLFSADDVANNETLVSQIAGENSFKSDPNDIIGNELIQFTPSMLDFDIDNSSLLGSLKQDAEVPLASIGNVSDDLPSVTADQITASEAAEFFLNNGTLPRLKKMYKRTKVPKIQKNKRRKIK